MVVGSSNFEGKEPGILFGFREAGEGEKK